MHTLREILLMALRQAWGCRPWFTVLLLVCMSGTSNQAWSGFYPEDRFSGYSETSYDSCDWTTNRCRSHEEWMGGPGVLDYSDFAGTQGGSHKCTITWSDGPVEGTPDSFYYIGFIGRVESDAHAVNQATIMFYFDLVWKQNRYVPIALRPSIKLLLDAEFVNGIPCQIFGWYGGNMDGLPYEISPGIWQYRGYGTMQWGVAVGKADLSTGGFDNHGPYWDILRDNTTVQTPEVDRSFSQQIFVKDSIIQLVSMSILFRLGPYQPGYGADYNCWLDPTIVIQDWVTVVIDGVEVRVNELFEVRSRAKPYLFPSSLPSLLLLLED